MAKYVKTEQGYIDASIFAPAQFKPEGKSYLTFSSPKNFTLEVNNRTKNWDGILEYFAYDKTWTVWDGTTILSAYNNDGEYVLYLRGTGNTKITGNGINKEWIITGTDVKCIGNIENLLDYITVEAGNHPTMTTSCYSYMFKHCTSITQAPDLPATTLASHCYEGMFLDCYSLTKAPKLPATTLSDYCYREMFSGCISLTQAPALPATTLASYCYFLMFFNCSSFTQAPALPATKLASHCYDSMFHYCTSLTQAPALPATTLSDYCYQYMFSGCISLTKAPKLPATTLASYCYDGMFRQCSRLTKAPKLPATTLSVCCYRGMFSSCTSLTQAPKLPATTLSDYCYPTMFSGCISLIQIPALPATTLASHCYDSMFERCTALKLSSTKTVEYAQEYRIPTTGTGTTATDALTNMFVSTGGTFTGTPAINTTYYLSTDNMIVRDTEVATLNGYVGSMIDNSVSNPLNITGATVGQIIKVKTVQDGKPTEWEAVNPDYTLTVTVNTQDGVTVTGQTVTVRAGDADGPVYGTAEYNGQPVSFRVPDGFAYYAEVTDNLAAHFKPTTVKGVINGANAAVTLLYNDFSTIQTAPDIQAALNADMDLTGLVGQQITCQRGNDTLSWDVVDYDSTAKVVTLCTHDVLPEAIQFEPVQALMYCEDGLAAGSYTFKWNNTQCYFTLTQAIPAGGQLRATDSEYQTYESQSAIAQIESGTVSTDVIDGATNLGKTGTGNLNDHDRVTRGSNNFGESGILQWLNSDSPAGASPPRQTKFSRPYVLSKAGFKAGLDVDFLACIQDTVWKCNANNNYECPASLGGIAQKNAPYTVTAKFALASAIEIFGEYGGVADGSTIWDLYTGAETTDRIKYYNNVKRSWLLRSPLYANSHNISYVNHLGNSSIGGPDGNHNFAVACKIAKSN